MRYIIIILCFIFLSSSAQQVPIRDEALIRDAVAKTANSQLHVRELTGRNDGIDVEKYLKYVWLKKGDPWCASYVSWCFGQNNIKSARAGGCVLLMEQGTVIVNKGKQLPNKPPPQKSDVFFIWYAEKNRVAHTGLITSWGDMVATIEGNTNGAGSREGNGVYKKWRQRIQIYAVADFTKKK